MLISVSWKIWKWQTCW